MEYKSRPGTFLAIINDQPTLALTNGISGRGLLNVNYAPVLRLPAWGRQSLAAVRRKRASVRLQEQTGTVFCDPGETCKALGNWGHPPAAAGPPLPVYFQLLIRISGSG